jgi:hypothetical protein
LLVDFRLSPVILSALDDWRTVRRPWHGLLQAAVSAANPQQSGVGYIADGALAIDGSRIVAVDSTEALLSHFEGTKVIEAANCAVCRG